MNTQEDMIKGKVLLLFVCCLFVVFYIAVWHQNLPGTNKFHAITEIYTKSEILHTMKKILLRRNEASNNSQSAINDYDRKTGKENTTLEMQGSLRTENTDNGNNSMGISNTRKKRRKLIIILTQGRSGSSLLGNLFNRDIKAFYIYEPFRTIEKLNNFIVFEIENKTTLEFFEKEASAFLSGLGTCIPNEVFDKYMNEFDDFGTRSRTSLFSREPFRNARVNSPLTTKLCSSNTTYTVIKELELRMPKNITNLVNLSENLGLDLKLIHLVRDPRASLLSQMKLDWFFEETNLTKRRMDKYVQNRCDETLNILKEVKNSKNFRGKINYILLRYEDIIDHPNENLRKISNFTGTNVYTTSKDWLTKMMSGAGVGEQNRYIDGIRNASAVKVAWKSQISRKLLDEVQRSCAELMRELNYLAIK